MQAKKSMRDDRRNLRASVIQSLQSCPRVLGVPLHPPEGAFPKGVGLLRLICLEGLPLKKLNRVFVMLLTQHTVAGLSQSNLNSSISANSIENGKILLDVF